MTDQEVVRRMRAAQVAGGAASGWAMVGGGEGFCDLSVGTGIGRPFRPGEMVWLDAGCLVRGYWSDYSRAAVLGPASVEQHDAWGSDHPADR